MPRIELLSGAEQVAAHLREEVVKGRWPKTMPGRARLAQEMGVSGDLVEVALQYLEDEGLIASQGPRRRRRVVLPEDGTNTRPLRIRILPYEKLERGQYIEAHLVESLKEAGHEVLLAKKSLQDLGMDAGRVARFVGKTSADAWIVDAGSQEVLRWFAHQPVPAIALFGRFIGLPIAASCPRKVPALTTAVARLVSLGHRRIVMLARTERRQPKPALYEQRFLDELDRHGIRRGPYNLPEWEDSADGLQQCLESLFGHTPPTALITSEPHVFFATQQFLARRGIVAPEKISLISDDPDPLFSWANPGISHISWDRDKVFRRVVRWAQNIARGKDDRRQTLFDAEFIEGGTIGPAP